MFSLLRDSLLTIPIDCLRFEPFSDEPYIINIYDSAPILTITSPVFGDTTRVFGLFTVEIVNPGSIADGQPSWEQ